MKKIESNLGQSLLYTFCVSVSGGTLTIEDLRSFQVQVQDAWTVPLGDAKLYIPPPPAGGALLAFILKLMEGVVFCVIFFFRCNSWMKFQFKETVKQFLAHKSLKTLSLSFLQGSR